MRATAIAPAKTRIHTMCTGPSVKGTGENTCLMVLGDGSQSRMAAFWMMTDSATVASIGISMGWSRRRRSTSRSMTAPTTPTPTTASALETKKLSPASENSVYRKNAPSMYSSPWAKFTTRMIPKIRVRPMPMSA